MTKPVLADSDWIELTAEDGSLFLVRPSKIVVIDQNSKVPSECGIETEQGEYYYLKMNYADLKAKLGVSL